MPTYRGPLDHNVNMYIGVDHRQKVGNTVILESLGPMKLSNYNCYPQEPSVIEV